MSFGPAGALYTQSVTGTAGGIGSGNIPTPASYAEGYVRTASVVVRSDGTAPTATVGTVADIGDQIMLRSREEILAFQAIREGGTSASIDWDFYTEAPPAGFP